VVVDEAKPLHEIVAKLVSDAGLSKQELAARTGWKYLRVLRLLNGKTELSADDMRVIAEVIERPVGELYGEEASA
jgi:transcriptional regulator with XRE-family HTH domain